MKYYPRLERTGRNGFVLVLMLIAAVLLSFSGSAFAFKAPDNTQAGSLSAEQFQPEGLKAVREGNHGKMAGADPESAAIYGVDHLMKEAGSTAVTMKIKRDKLGFQHVHLAQYYNGLPVVGAELIVHINKENVIYLVHGNYLPSISVSTDPAISPADALRVGLEELAGKSGLHVTEDPQLVIYGTQLAYQYVLSHDGSEVGKWRYYVDAQNGNLIFRFNDIKFGAPTGNGSAQEVTGSRLAGEDGSIVTVSGWKETSGNYYLYDYVQAWGVFDEVVNDWEQQATNDWGTADRVAISLGDNFSITQNWVAGELGRNSYDNTGGFARGNIHYGTNYVNAYWDGTEFYFGDGDGVSANPLATLDVAAHEYGHAITQYTSNLNYSRESGALNESYSDIMGTLVEFASQPDGRASYPSATPGTADWLIGEDCWLSDVALRDMRNPQRYQQPSYYKGTYWYAGLGDNGGVHTNSGVQNFTFYLLAEGGTGTNDGHAYSLTGLGIPAAGEVAMRANMYYLTATSKYADSRNAWISAATDLGYDTETVAAVWNAVGVSTNQCNQITQTITPPTNTNVSPGGTLTFSVTLANACSAAASFYMQQYTVKPSGVTSWFPKVQSSLAAGKTKVLSKTITVPLIAQKGTYRWGSVISDASGTQYDNDSFTYVVQ